MSAMAFAVAVCFVCLGSCSKSDDPTPAPSPVNKDTKSPAITVKSLTFNVYGGKTVIVEAGRLTIGGEEVATWTDDKSAADKCIVALSFAEATTKADAANDNAPGTKSDAGTETKAGTTIKSGDTLDKAGTLKLTVTDEAGNAASKSITLTAPNGAPVITVIKNGLNVYGGKAVTVEANVLKIGGEEAASWTDDHDADCVVALFFRERDAITGYYIAGAGIEIKSGDPIDKAGILMITVTDEAGNKAEKSITLTAQ